MKFYKVSDKSVKTVAENFSVSYDANHIIFPDLRREYAEQVFKAVTLYNRGGRLSTYEAVTYGKETKTTRIYQRYDNTFDIVIERVVNMGENNVFREYVFTGNYSTLRRAVKAKHTHFKD